MTSVRTHGIRPTFHSLIAWIILIALACALLVTLISTTNDFVQGRKQLAQYQSDCAGVAPTPVKNPSGACYYANDYVSFQSPPADTGLTTADALLTDTHLVLTKVRLAGSYSTETLPMSGNKDVQVWRGKPVKIKLGSGWTLTSADPAYYTSITALLAWLIATLAAWAIVVAVGLLLLRGLRSERAEQAETADTEPSFRMGSPVS